MTFQTFLRVFAALLALFLASCKQSPVSASPQVYDAWARETAEGQKMAAAYLAVSNPGETPIRLVSVDTPAASASSIHESKVENGVASMKSLDEGLAIAPGETVTLKPGGSHVMFKGLTRPLGKGDEIALTLTFDDGTRITVPVTVSGAGER